MHRTKIAIIAALATLAMAPLAADAAKPPKAPKPQGNLTLTPTPNPVKYGRSVTLSGRLGGAKVAGQTVNLFADPYPYATLTKAASVKTNATGDYSLTQKPTQNTRYQARRGGDQSSVVTVLVRPAVSLGLSDSTPKRGRRVRFSGRVCPQHDGSILAIQRRSSGHYRTVRRTALLDVPGSACSRYRKSFRVYHDGRYRAVIGHHADHASGVSRSRVADVHR